MDKILDYIIEQVKKKKLNGEASIYENVSLSVNKLYGTLYTAERIRGICRRYRYENNLDENFITIGKKEDSVGQKEVISINSDGSIVSEKIVALTSEQCKNPSELLRIHGYDPIKFTLSNAKSSVWQSSGGKTLYSSRITVKPSTDINIEEIKKAVVDVVKNTKTQEYTPTQYKSGAECLIPTFFDIHFAKLCHNAETGNDYDFKIAKNRFIGSAKKYIDKFKDRKFEKIILPIGNDYFNSEATGDTTGNTRQDNDTRYSKMFKEGLATLISVIELFKQVAPVEVILVQGNHDFFVSFYAACALEFKYENDKLVTVDAGPNTRKYRIFGKNLFGFTHGSEEKERIFTLMQSEAPELWGLSLYRDWFTGHFHKLGVEEKGGVSKWSIPSLCGTDAWHSKMGFTQSIKRVTCFVYDKECGLTDISFVNIV